MTQDKRVEEYDTELATEKAYVNAYAEFVDEMSVGTPFDQAFETLNDKLSAIIDHHPLSN